MELEGPRAAPQIRVLLAEHNPSARRALTQILRTYSDVEVIGAAITGEEAVERSRSLQPDVVLMDSSLLGMSGLSATREIRRHCHGTGVVILTMHGELERAARAAGACDFLLKGCPADVLMEALRRAAARSSAERGRHEEPGRRAN